MGNAILGIDIGRSGIKAVQVAVGIKGKVRITAAEQYDFQTCGGVSGALDKLRSDERFQASKCVTSLPAELFSFRNLQMPFREKRKIRQTLNFELEPLLPFPIDEVATDFTVIEQNGGSDILAAAVSREALTGRLGELEPFEVSLVDIDAVSIATSLVSGFSRRPAESGQTRFILLDIGSSGTTAVFLRRGRIFQIRTFPFGADTVTGTDEAAARCEKFCEELDHTLQFMKLRRSEEKPWKIFVTGGGAECGPVLAALERRFSIPVETVDLRMVRQISMPAELSGWWSPPRMNGALALALRGAGKADGFNFRLGARKGAGVVRLFTGNLRQIGAVLLTVFGILVFDSAAGYFIDQRYLANLKAESERILKTASPETKRVADPVQQLKAKIAEAKKFTVSGTGADAGVLDLLKKISEAVPGDVSFLISDLSYDGEKVEIRGETSDFDTVEKIKRGMTAAGFFRDISVSGARLVKEKNRVEFEVRMSCAR